MTFIQTLWAWLLTPISGSTSHDIESIVSWHARLMVLGWGILLPVGMLIARFFKVTARQNWPHELDNKRWWHLHLMTQSSGLLLAIVGIYLTSNFTTGSSKSQLYLAHYYSGWTVMSLGVLQALGGLLRGTKGGPSANTLRGDHYDMTKRRRVFEAAHKSLGYVALLLSVCVIIIGLIMSDAPRWMPLILCIWWVGLSLIFATLQKNGRCFDTYQAIWGDSSEHPGNQLPSAGWGSRRYNAESFSATFKALKTIKGKS